MNSENTETAAHRTSDGMLELCLLPGRGNFTLRRPPTVLCAIQSSASTMAFSSARVSLIALLCGCLCFTLVHGQCALAGNTVDPPRTFRFFFHFEPLTPCRRLPHFSKLLVNGFLGLSKSRLADSFFGNVFEFEKTRFSVCPRVHFVTFFRAGGVVSCPMPLNSAPSAWMARLLATSTALRRPSRTQPSLAPSFS